MVYVMSDIHGNMRRFNSILKQIALKPEDTLYILGDVIDRHPDGIKILRRIMDMPNVKMLLGNHEYMMLEAIGEPYDGSCREEGAWLRSRVNLWYSNGGAVTHRSWKHIKKELRPSIIAYLHALPLNIDIQVGGRAFKLVHGAATEMKVVYGSERCTKAHFSVWDRYSAAHMCIKEDYTLIFGHTPTENLQDDNPMRIWHGTQRVGIDCGSGYPETDDLNAWYARGRLACLRLDDMKEFYSEEPLWDDGKG